MHDPVVLVFQRSTSVAKSRLSARLSPSERTLLVRACLERIRMASAPLPVVALVEDATAGMLAKGADLETLAQARADLNAALADAVAHLAARGARGVLVVPADLPFFALPPGLDERAAVAADHHLTGTTALWLPDPARGFDFRFGEGSLLLHIAEARRRYGAVRLLGNRFLLDLDTTDDLDLANTLVELDPELAWPEGLARIAGRTERSR